MKSVTFILISVIIIALQGCTDDSTAVVPNVSVTTISVTTTPTTPTTPGNPTTPTTPTTPTNPTTPTTPTNPASQYYITFKANGTAVSETVVSATRGTTTNPRTVTITGTGANGSVPMFTFFMEESFIGFVKGLNVGNKDYTYPSNYIEYTNSANALYSTKNDASGISLFVSDISYTNGGTIAGTFNGSIKTDDGASVQITEGTFNVKFSN